MFIMKSERTGRWKEAVKVVCKKDQRKKVKVEREKIIGKLW